MNRHSIKERIFNLLIGVMFEVWSLRSLRLWECYSLVTCDILSSTLVASSGKQHSFPYSWHHQTTLFAVQLASPNNTVCPTDGITKQHCLPYSWHHQTTLFSLQLASPNNTVCPTVGITKQHCLPYSWHHQTAQRCELGERNSVPLNWRRV